MKVSFASFGSACVINPIFIYGFAVFLANVHSSQRLQGERRRFSNHALRRFRSPFAANLVDAHNDMR